MKIKLALACHNASGIPELIGLEVEVTEADYAMGAHYEEAVRISEENGYEAPFVCFDERDSKEVVGFVHDN